MLTRHLTATPVDTVQPVPQFGMPVAHAVLFWMDTCPHCHEVIENVLPPLEAQYGPQLEILLVEIKTAEEFERLYPLAACHHIPQDLFGVPFLVIGEHGLLGPDEIAAELPDLVASYLAAGGVDLPDSPCLAAVMAAADLGFCRPDNAECAEEIQVAGIRPSGFGLAITVLAGMVGVLVLSAGLTIREWRTAPRCCSTLPPSRSGWVFPLLALAGLAVAGYLAYVEMRDVPAVCGPVGDCNAVQNSPYALLLGFLPVGLLGVLGYIAILVVWLYGRFGRGRVARWSWPVLLGLTLVGTLFSLYLTYLEPFVIRAVCAWCLTSAVIMSLLLLLSIRPAMRTWRGTEVSGEKSPGRPAD
ncbi:MAG: vitamin K epoxide reductase family protein [Candidatus Oleimicrobiaceae bacterium]